MEISETERAARLALNDIFGCSPKIANAIIAQMGGALPLFEISPRQRQLLLGTGWASKIPSDSLEHAFGTLEYLEKTGAAFITAADPSFPQLLLECEDPPVGLYVRGNHDIQSVLASCPGVAVVGTRDISPYGAAMCRQLVNAFAGAPRRPCVISGFAMGVDITAHLSCLESGVPTIAVLPTGIDNVYPSRHWRIADRLCSTPGCSLVTDYPLKTVPQAFNFLRRNRLIAGMATSTILVESRCRGGGMVTARMAFSYSREVYAFPGRMDDVRSGGCLQLMAEKIASPIVGMQSLVEELGLGKAAAPGRRALNAVLAERYSSVSADKALLLSKVALEVEKERGITLMEVSEKTGLPFSQVLQAAGRLENDGILEIDVLQRCSIK